jgi:hypothetical protein
MVQLARPKPGLTQPLGPYQFQNSLVALARLILASQPLVIRLSAYSDMVASPANAQALNELLREDLPKGFFTTLTP